MKISKKKLRLYKSMEFCGKAVFWITLAVVWISRMIGSEVGEIASFLWMLVGMAILFAGTQLRVGLYVCPVCGRKLLVNKAGPYRAIDTKLPTFCASCGWKVHCEEE